MWGGLPPLPPFLPRGDEQPFKSIEAFGCCAAGFMCGVAGRGQQGLGEQRQRREAGGHAWGIAMATRCGQHHCTAAQGGGAAGADVQPAMQPRPSCAVGSAPLGSCIDNPASRTVLLGQQPQGGWPGVFCPSALFHSLLGNGQAAPVCGHVLFEALSCRAGPAGKKPIS